MIAVLGASGYIGSAFAKELNRRGIRWKPIKTKGASLKQLYDVFGGLILDAQDFLINCAAFIPTPSVDLCKDHPDENYHVNLSWPTHFAQYCAKHAVPMAHIGSACYYDEAKEYTEDDQPTRKGLGYCSAYLTAKRLSEQAVRAIQPNSYVWRIRLPFDEFDSPRNYLTKLRSFPEVWEQTNSLTHRGDFVKSALDMIERKAPYGVYNCCNNGSANAVWLAQHMRMVDALKGDPTGGDPTEEPKSLISIVAQGPVPGCRLSTAKLEATGCGMRPVADAVEDALRNWRK